MIIIKIHVNAYDEKSNYALHIPFIFFFPFSFFTVIFPAYFIPFSDGFIFNNNTKHSKEKRKKNNCPFSQKE